MRKLTPPRVVLVMALVTLAVLAATTPVPANPASEIAQDGREAARTRHTARGHVECGGLSRDNFATLTYLHFGNPAAGVALIETWIDQTYSDLCLPITNQGVGRAVRVRNVERVAARVILHTRDGTTDDDATGPAVNSGNVGNPTILTVTSPRISTGGLAPNPQFCTSWTEVLFTIRWTDGTVTLGRRLVAPTDLWNANCYFTGP